MIKPDKNMTIFTIKKYFFLMVIFFSGVHIFCQDFYRVLEVKNNRMYGNDIIALQQKLISYGFNEIDEADGYYGPLTEGAIKTLQYFLGFDQDGKVSGKLWESIFNDSNKNLIRNINTVSKYKIEDFEKVTESRMGYSTEGGYFDKYLLNNKVKKIDLVLFGEMGKAEYYFYYLDDTYYFLVIKDYRYHMPETDAELEGYDSFYDYLFSEENLKKTKIEYSAYLKNGNQFHGILEGSLVQTDFDINGLIYLLEHSND